MLTVTYSRKGGEKKLGWKKRRACIEEQMLEKVPIAPWEKKRWNDISTNELYSYMEQALAAQGNLRRIPIMKVGDRMATNLREAQLFELEDDIVRILKNGHATVNEAKRVFESILNRCVVIGDPNKSD